MKKIEQGEKVFEPREKVFKGKVYRLYLNVSTKEEANHEKKKLKDSGYKARITKEKGGYAIWWMV